MSHDLRSFLDFLRHEHPEELLEIDIPVSIDYEMSSLVLYLEQQKRYPALLFKNIIGFKAPVVCNLFASRKRLALALRLHENDLISMWPKLAERRIKPLLVEGGPVKEIRITGDEVDLRQYPIPWHFEADAGRYITSGIIVARDPETGVGNLSYARLQLKTKNRMGISLHSRGNLWDYQRRCENARKPLEIAIVIGVHPAISIAAATRLPMNDDEMELAGGLLGEPVEVTHGETVGLLIPSHAEMVIEGYIEPNVREEEGPFGEYTGYASDRSTQNVVQITAILHRKDMIYHDIIPGASSEHLNLSKVSRVPQYFHAVKRVIPNVIAMNYPHSGTHFHCYLSMHDPIPGQAKQAMALLFGLDMYLKLIIVVNDDIDVYDEEQVLWALATRFQADRDLIVIPQVMCNLLDPSSSGGVGAKVGLDATRKFSSDVKVLTYCKERLSKFINTVLFELKK